MFGTQISIMGHKQNKATPTHILLFDIFGLLSWVEIHKTFLTTFLKLCSLILLSHYYLTLFRNDPIYCYKIPNLLLLSLFSSLSTSPKQVPSCINEWNKSLQGAKILILTTCWIVRECICCIQGFSFHLMGTLLW